MPVARPASTSPTRSLQFTRQRGFRRALNERVAAYLVANHIPERDLPGMYMKTLVALAWWLGAYTLLLLGGLPPLVNVVLCVVWAMAIASVGFNVMHDANHRGYSNNPRINSLLSLSAEMLGISGFRWRTVHNVWHHTYTNIAGFDDDVETHGDALYASCAVEASYRFQVCYFPWCTA